MDKSEMLKIIRSCISAFLIYIFSFPANAHLFAANGSLSTPDGIDGLGSWGAGLTTLSWGVDHTGLTGLETIYTYTFEHPDVSTFEFIIEVHPNMITDLTGLAIYNVNSTLPNYELGIFNTGASTPGMPDAIPGVRFWGDGGSTIETISFISNYLPMWGDFYATDRNAVAAAWNTGFASPDSDPSQTASSGSIDFHMLVPGEGGIQIVPIPAAAWLFGSGLIGLIGLARRKKA